MSLLPPRFLAACGWRSATVTLLVLNTAVRPRHAHENTQLAPKTPHIPRSYREASPLEVPRAAMPNDLPGVDLPCTLQLERAYVSCWLLHERPVPLHVSKRGALDELLGIYDSNL